MFDALATDTGEPGAQPLLPMVGHTRDISETGLAIVVTSGSPGRHRDELVGRELRIGLELPSGLTELRCTVVRTQQLAEAESDESFLLGVRITQMNDKDWVDMVRYIFKLQERD